MLTKKHRSERKAKPSKHVVGRSLRPIVGRGFSASAGYIAILHSLDIQNLGLYESLMPYQINAHITLEMVSTARIGKSILDRMMPNPSVHPSGGASPTVSGATRCSAS